MKKHGTAGTRLAREFQTEYENTYAPELPEQLKEYHFISFLREKKDRDILLLENASGRQVICKHSRGDYITLLRTERDLGKYSFFPCVIDYCETESDSYLIREYIEGDTLEERVEKHGPMEPAQARNVMLQLCRCFLLLHHSEPPVIYRDLKPSNVVLTRSGECFLIDLGSARSFQEGNERDTMLVGTLATAAPEQYGAGQSDMRTDIYALGILYAYLLTGKLNKHWESGSLPKGPEAAIIRKAVSFDPKDRYQSIEELTDALDPPPSLPDKKHYLAAILALSAVVLALSATLICGLFVLSAASSSKQPAAGNLTADNPAENNTGKLPNPISAKNPEDAPGADDEVAFGNNLLRRAITSALGKEEGETVRYGELDQITSLLVCGEVVFDRFEDHGQSPYAHTVDGSFHSSFTDLTPSSFGDIRDLSLLAHMSNLHDLVLDYQQISDLSPLAGLNLVNVSLCGNPLSDLSPLADCIFLSSLAIDDTRVNSLAPLEDLLHIQDLSITRSKVTDLSPVSRCPINYLVLGDNVLTDYECLQRMPIRCLHCRALPKSALEPLSSISTLTLLNLQESNITSIRELSMFRQLTDLDLGQNPHLSLEGVGELTSLTTLWLGGDELTDLSGLETGQSIRNLGVNTNPVEDFTALRQLTNLRTLHIDDSMADKLYEAVPEPWFEVLP